MTNFLMPHAPSYVKIKVGEDIISRYLIKSNLEISRGSWLVAFPKEGPNTGDPSLGLLSYIEQPMPSLPYCPPTRKHDLILQSLWQKAP